MMTSLYAALLGLMLIALSIKVIRARRKYGVGVGDADNIEIRRCIRAQANFAEYTPIFLIILGYAELKDLPIWAVNIFGILFLAGRIMHAHSLLNHEQYDVSTKLIIHPKWRIRGMICTFLAIGLVSVVIFIQSAIHFFV
jgi:uncharacterized membrane protein YecN with MAPEG domain